MGERGIAGTRLSVELVLKKLGAGESVDDLFADYPHLSCEAILAAIRFSSRRRRSPGAEPKPPGRSNKSTSRPFRPVSPCPSAPIAVPQPHPHNKALVPYWSGDVGCGRP